MWVSPACQARTLPTKSPPYSFSVCVHVHTHLHTHTCTDRHTHVWTGTHMPSPYLVVRIKLFGSWLVPSPCLGAESPFSATVLCCSKLAGHKRAANYPVPASILPQIHCRYRHRHEPARLPFNVDSQDTNSGHRVVFQPPERSLWPDKKDAVPVGHSSAQQSS